MTGMRHTAMLTVDEGNPQRKEVKTMAAERSYKRPVLAPKYEPPILLDLESFVTVAGGCSTGGGSCVGTGP